MSAYDALYQRHAQGRGFEWYYLAALARASTGEAPDRIHCGHGERRYYQRKMRGRPPWNRAQWDDEAMSARYGLLSVPYRGAVECGWPIERAPEDLLDPDTNILYGARWLAACMARHAAHISPAIAAYHSAWGIAQLEDGRFTCQPFVDRVCRLAERIRASQMPQEPRSRVCPT
jgi:hypothetical protein